VRGLGRHQLIDRSELLQDLLATALPEAPQRVLPLLGERLHTRGHRASSSSWPGGRVADRNDATVSLATSIGPERASATASEATVRSTPRVLV
jgi:hypothetical protein